MDLLAHLATLTPAEAGLIGVVLGAALVAGKEYVVSLFKRKKELEYLAIIVTSHLDRFANGCLAVAYDDGTQYGRPAGMDGCCQTTTTPPVFAPMDIDVEWKSLPRDLMYSILQIPDKAEQLSQRLAGIVEFDDPPDYPDFFEARRYGYAQLGRNVSDIAKRLRKQGGMPIEKPVAGEWSRDAAFIEIMDSITAERAAYEKRIAERRAEKEAASLTPPAATQAPRLP